MNQNPTQLCTIRGRSVAWVALALLLAISVEAQLAPSVDATTLARYDKNHNGRLDADELAALAADRPKTVPVEAKPVGDETVTLSPFEVVADTKGYFAANTMSGTRLNSKLEDLGASISIVTTEQMADFAMLDLNDVFLYSLNTEGTGTFTSFDANAGSQGEITDTVSGDPANANRVRGIGNANVSNGNFETSNRVPIDPIDADAVEISRGPNANIFGLGNASGTVNIVGAAANLQRNRSQVALRADSDDGYRASLDLNRVLLRDQLALRLSLVRQHDGFDLKPSGVETNRLNGMVQFRPFSRTTLKATYQDYRAHGNRPNSLPPLDGISDWRAAGSPSWDPLTNSMYAPDGTFLRTGSPAYLFTPAANYNQLFIDRNGVERITQTFGVSGNSPGSTAQSTGTNTRKLVVTRALVNDTQPLIARQVEMITDKKIYDWSSINLAAPNRFNDRTKSLRVTLDQMCFETTRQSLAVQAGWFREESDRYTNYLLGDGRTNGPTGQLAIDVNTRLLDGTRNPYYLRPLLALITTRSRVQPLSSDNYRGQFAYKVDFTREKNFSRWLGRHGLVGYAEYKEKIQRSYQFSLGFNDRGASGGQNYNRFYVGDNQGLNVDYAPGTYGPGTSNFTWGNAVSGAFTTVPATIADVPTFAPSLLNGASGTLAIQKTAGGILQSALLRERVVTTLGLRRDRHFTRQQNPTAVTADGLDYDYAYVNQWRKDADWQTREGNTRQGGVVVRPFRGLDFVKRRAASGAGAARLAADFLDNLSLHYNRSESFLPAPPARNVFGEFLPDPSGRSKDYGFSLSLLDGRFVIRVNKYETRQANSRSGASAGLASVLASLDYTSTAFALQQEATAWITAANRAITPAQLTAELTKVMGVPPKDLAEVAAYPFSETDDVIGKGHELELHFNPTRHWTLTANIAEQRTINANLARNVALYNARRLPLWTTIKDPRIDPRVEPGQLWWNHLYGGAETPFENCRRRFANPFQTAVATDGLARPQVRRYRGTVSTNFRLAGLTDHRLLRNFNVGGALRFETKGAIGYYGAQQLPAIITAYDYQRPVWDKGHIYADAFLGYRRRLFADKVGATFQLNVRNLQEGGRLQPIGAFPDGTPNSFRIVSPRQFILSATFDL
ncbi:MAG: TonB-dependent receptor [Verrucomicrobia bacterium]|nr:TonB-dependent receptor [Verrucomicrobiota bacterium]